MIATFTVMDVVAPDGGRIAVAYQVTGLPVADSKRLARGLSDRVGAGFGHSAPRVSRSGSSGVAACAFGDATAVGVDVETIAPGIVDRDLLELALHVEEARAQPPDVDRAFFDLWTRKEAVLKAIGTGLATSPTLVNVGWGGSEWRSVQTPGGQAVSVRSFRVSSAFSLAVAIGMPGGG